jgi:hypothetical protein
VNKQTLFGSAIFGLEGDLKFHQIMSNLNAKNLHFYHGKKGSNCQKNKLTRSAAPSPVFKGG